jgi:hypothetical protein
LCNTGFGWRQRNLKVSFVRRRLPLAWLVVEHGTRRHRDTCRQEWSVQVSKKGGSAENRVRGGLKPRWGAHEDG